MYQSYLYTLQNFESLFSNLIDLRWGNPFEASKSLVHNDIFKRDQFQFTRWGKRPNKAKYVGLRQGFKLRLGVTVFCLESLM